MDVVTVAMAPPAWGWSGTAPLGELVPSLPPRLERETKLDPLGLSTELADLPWAGRRGGGGAGAATPRKLSVRERLESMEPRGGSSSLGDAT